MSAGDRFLTTAKFEVFSKNLNRRLAALGVAPVTSTTTVIHQGAERFIELLDCPDSYTGKHHTVLQPDSGEDYLEFTGSPTVANLYLSNDTDTPTDVLIQYLLGATPVAKFTMGIDDSDEDKWKLANKDALGTTPTSGGFIFGDTLYYVHGGSDSIAGVSLADFATDATYIAGGTGSGDGQFSGPKQIAFDETYIYVSDDVNNRVQKFLISDGSFVGKTADNVTRPWGCVYWDGFIYVGCLAGTYAQTIRKFDAETLIYQSAFGSVGSGDDQFNNPRGMTTDGTYLYIADYNNNRIKKHLLDGTYVAKTGSTGTGNGEFKGPTAIATDGTSLYVCDYANGRVQIFLCSDLSYVGQVAMQTRGGKVGAPMAITLDSDYFYVTSNNSDPYNGYIEKYDIATNTFQAFYDATGGVGGPLDTAWGAIILKVQQRLGDLLIVHQDGQYFDIYPKARHYDAIRLMEDSATQVEYVGIKAPSAITESYSLTLPAAVAAAQGHLYGSVTGVLAWGQDVNAAASPEFAGLTLTGEAGVLKATAGVVSSDAVIDDLDDVNATAPADQDVLTWDDASSRWIAKAPPAGGDYALADLTDVSFPPGEPDIGDVLIYQSGGWTSGPAGGSLAIDDLTDVNAAAPNDGDILVWDNDTSKWVTSAGGGSGAPTDAKYIVGAANATLSAEKVKAQLYKNYDIDDTPGSPNALDDEFDDSSLDVKWTAVNNPATRNWDETTFVGYLSSVIPETATTDIFDNYHRLYQAVPAGDYAITIIAKVSLALTGLALEDGEWADINIYFGNSTDDEWIGSAIQTNNATSPAPHGAANVLWATGSEGGAAGVTGSMGTIKNQNVDITSWVYLKLEKSTNAAWTSANTYNAYYSLNGIVWHQVGTDSKTFSHAVDEIGILCRGPKAQTGDPVSYPAIDFFRRIV